MNKTVSQDYELSYILEEGKHQATIHFSIYQKTAVLLKVENIQNKDVRVLLNEVLLQGSYQTVFSFGKLEGGKYSIKLIANTDNIIDINSLTIQIPKYEAN